METYLPVYESVRHWKDRRVRRELPLFPGYLFVRLPLCDRLRVLRTPSVVRIVEFSGQAAALPDQEIETLRRGLTRELGIEPYLYLKVGRRVRVETGPLQGLEGILVSKKNRSRFVISVDLSCVRSQLRLTWQTSSRFTEEFRARGSSPGFDLPACNQRQQFGPGKIGSSL